MDGGRQTSPRWILAAGGALVALALTGAWHQTRTLEALERTRTGSVTAGARAHALSTELIVARGGLRVGVCAPGGSDARATLDLGGTRVRLTRAASSVRRCTAAVWSTRQRVTVTPTLRFDAPVPPGTTFTLRAGGTLGAHNAWPFAALLLGVVMLVLAPLGGPVQTPRVHAVTAWADIARGMVRAVAGIVLAHLAAAFAFLSSGGGAVAMLGAAITQNLAMLCAAAWVAGALRPGVDLRDALELRPPPASALSRAALMGALLVVVALVVSARVHDAGDTPAGQDIERMPLRYVIVFGGLLAPLGEEVLYRGALGRLFARWGRAAVVLIPAGVFTAMHVAQLRGSPLALLPIAAVGAVNGALRLATGGVVAPWLVHTVYNAALVSSALLGT